ncbi:MAG: hypothetical protein WC761_01200 [Candidatus Paceibacterota bacterium]|jgi:hypothetical protein
MSGFTTVGHGNVQVSGSVGLVDQVQRAEAINIVANDVALLQGILFELKRISKYFSILTDEVIEDDDVLNGESPEDL